MLIYIYQIIIYIYSETIIKMHMMLAYYTFRQSRDMSSVCDGRVGISMSVKQ